MQEIKNLPTSKYEIVESKDNLFRIFKDGEALVNPHGYVIPAIGLRFSQNRQMGNREKGGIRQ